METTYSQLPDTYRIILQIMTFLAVVVYLVLQYIKVGYGFLRDRKWGPAIPNRIGWIIMELPVFIFMLVLFIIYGLESNISVKIMTFLFLGHYFQRSFIFPFLIKGRSKMPISVVIMGICFNLVNVYLIGSWLFIYSSPPFYSREFYTTEWLLTPQFIIGTLIFLFGMVVNLHSDHIIRNLRKKGDSKHYIPRGGMFRFVSSANYFGEITEWFGFAILTWSLPGALFCIWTFANLAPRANSLYEKYTEEFGEEFTKLKRKRVIPFIY